MLRWLLRHRLDSEEKRLGVPVDYLRHVLDVSPGALLRFASILPLANCRKKLPKDAWAVASITALLHADCGTCVQIGVNLARKDGVDRQLLSAALDGRCEDMSDEMADVVCFTRSVLDETSQQNDLRETMRTRYGERGLIELAYAIAGSQVPPLVKRGLGYAKSCSAVKVTV